MRAAVKMLLLSFVVFAVAFAIRRAFFWDVKPIAWSDDPPQGGALDVAFLLLSIENIAAVVATIALLFVSALWVKRRQHNQVH
jgi:hypothetical protein